MKKRDFAQEIIAWYHENKRDLPWRQTTDPYHIWLSEIILQQTRVEQGLNYYLRFIESFPNIYQLAEANEDEVLKLWQGLGYYNRARNMHQTAKTICTAYNGKFPASYNELLSLKGIGDYTASAIASMAFGLPHPSIDGNVFRVLSRVYGINEPIDTGNGKKAFSQLASELIDKNQPGTFNQAVMEFGSLQCKAQNPKCSGCNLNEMCFAYLENKIAGLPVKKGKTKITKRYFSYLIIKKDNSTYINKRNANGIWGNLYQFPLIETKSKVGIVQLIPEIEQICGTNEITLEQESRWEQHLLSHQHIYYRFISLLITDQKNIAKDLIEVNKKDIFKFAVPKLIEREININNWFSLIHDNKT